MSDWKLHTPTGVNDILPDECKMKKDIETMLWNVFVSMGYKEVETPTFEFYDVFSGDGGQISQENMFKFFDEHGRIMALRPDMTTSIARMVATKESCEFLPLRYCYTGNVFRSEQTEGARQREFTQSGIELIGSSSPAADAEVIAAAMEAVLTAGIEEFQMEIGQVAFFGGLIEEMGITPEDTEKLRKRIDSKDTLGIKNLMEKLDANESVKSLMLELPYLFGGRDVFARARVKGLNTVSEKALLNIENIYNLLCSYGYEKYISVDLGMLQSIDYYTGVIFKCFTHGVSFPVCAGGRYDNLISKFGKNMNAVGVAFGVNRIMSALRARGIENEDAAMSNLIYPEENAYELAYEISYRMREFGCMTEMYLGGGDFHSAEDYALSTDKESLIRVFPNGRILIREFAKKDIIETTADEFLKYYDDGSDDCDEHTCGCHDHDEH